MNRQIDQNWYILQDVNNTCEKLGIFKEESFITDQGPQISEWEPISHLKHLQLLFSQHPYWGRELRYFNYGPWWYKNEFEADNGYDHYELFFSNVDYYCKVWLNGILIGSHEGYSSGFSLNADQAIQKEGLNRLIIKVWSPWETDIENDEADRRTFKVKRNLVKGTYEHSDTFIQRDVNPVGIYGKVLLKEYKDAWFETSPVFEYTLDDKLQKADLAIRAKVRTSTGGKINFVCRDYLTNQICCQTQKEIEESGSYCLNSSVTDVHLWNVWDRGTPYTYMIKIWIESENGVTDCYEELTGFRKIEMIRNEGETSFVLNNQKIYIRGTSYFPDNYISAMNRERYKSDLLKIINCGFNFVRVHVHVEFPEFYQLCTEMGVGIIQDSEYNWTHPDSKEYEEKFIRIFLENIKWLKKYPAVLAWICMNEPGSLDANNTENRDNSHGKAMDISPGPALYEAVLKCDPSRPAIKGSYCEQDLLSGDSHNYIGSLCGEEGHYTDIYDMKEKLNTEYGFDAPPCIDNLMKVPDIYKRLSPIEHKIDKIWDYQYRLLKYYTEHYRMQKYTPNAGYVQFLFSDIGPTSFYGLYDWWGIPKKGLDAMLESNMPVGIFIKYKEHLDSVYAVNDYYYSLGECEAHITITDLSGEILYEDSKKILMTADSKIRIFELNQKFGNHIDVALILKKQDQILAHNLYMDIYNMPPHIKGHPSRMSHEFGIRLYDC